MNRTALKNNIYGRKGSAGVSVMISGLLTLCATEKQKSLGYFENIHDAIRSRELAEITSVESFNPTTMLPLPIVTLPMQSSVGKTESRFHNGSLSLMEYFTA